MAVGPIQYLPQPKAFDLTQGLQIGGAIQGIRERSAAQEAKAEALRKADELKQQYSLDLQEAFKSKTPQAFAMLTSKYPQQREAFKQSYSMISDEQKKNEIAVQGQVLNALQGGKPEIAERILDERITALDNAGEDTTQIKQIKENIMRDPELAKGSIMFSLSNVMDPDKFVETYGKLGEEQRKAELQPGEIKKQTAELNKIAEDLKLSGPKKNKILAETRKLDVDTRKALLELESKKDAEGKITDPKDRFKAEESARKEWAKRTSDLSSANSNFKKIEISAKDATGPGDIALITSFMKMLDPGSVVRETEFATAQNTAGLFDALTNKLTKLQDGTLLGLDNKERQKFVTLAKKYRDAAQDDTKSVKKTFDNIISTYGFDPKNIYSDAIDEETTPSPIAEAIPMGKIVVQGGKRYRKTATGFEEVQ